MPEGDIARRQFLRQSANAISAVWLAAALGEIASAAALSCAPAKQSSEWHTFSNDDAADVEAIAALIIPSDGTPGARAARVIDFTSRVIQDTYELDPKVGIAGGGGFDFRHDLSPIAFALGGLPSDAPKWGPEYKRMLQEYYTRTVYVLAHATSLPVETNSITLDPAMKDAWGLPAIRMTFAEHPNDVKLNEYMQDRAMELLDAAGAKKSWRFSRDPWFPQVHLLGTCRMGNDPGTSVVDKHHRSHDVPNLLIVDGSSFVTSGRGQPTMTIQALAFRAAEHAARMAKQGQLT